MLTKILERIPNLPIIAICIAVILGTITGMLFFMSGNNKRDTLKYLETKYEETFEIKRELSYNEYLDITKENNISEEDFVFAYIVESKGSPDQSFVVGQYKGSMSHFFSPVPEKVWFDTYEKLIEENEETTTEVTPDITDDNAELSLKYLEDKYNKDFVILEEIKDRPFGIAYVAYLKDNPDHTFIVGKYDKEWFNTSFGKESDKDIWFDTYEEPVKDFETIAKEKLSAYLEAKYEEKFVFKERIYCDKCMAMIPYDFIIAEEDYDFGYIAYPEGRPDNVFVVFQYKNNNSEYSIYDTYVKILEPITEITTDINNEVSGITHNDAELILKYLETKYDEDFVCKEKITNTLAMPDEHGHLEVVKDIRSAYLFSPMNNRDITFAAGIKNTNAERFDFYEEVLNSKPIIPPYCN